MKLIFKYLKPYVLTVLVIVCFTFLQVQGELALPDRMSDIVTNGIQYGGIKESVPSALTKDDMGKILLFSEDDDKILAQYDLLNEGDTGVVANKKIEFSSPVYVLKKDSTDISNEMKVPMAYAYLADQQGMEINEENITAQLPIIVEMGNKVEENFDSINKLYISSLYGNVGVSAATVQNNYILTSGLVMLLIAGLSAGAQLLTTYLATKTASKVAQNIRSDVFKKIESFSSAEFSKFSTSSLITRTGNDIAKIQQLTQMMMRMMLMAPMMGITSVFKVIRYPSICWILIVAIVFILLVMCLLAIFALPRFEKIQKLTDRLNNVLREFLDGMLVIRAFNGQKREEEAFDEVNSDLTKTDRFVNKMMNIMGPVMTFMMNALSIIIIWFSAKQIDINVMTIGDMMAFTQYSMQVVTSFMMVTMMFVMVPRSLISAKRVQEVLDSTNLIQDPENPIEIPSENGKLVFDHVSFAYPNAQENVLEDINFEVEPAQTVAIIGSTGSGKSTISKLIPRLFDVTAGAITYCSHNIKDFKQEDLHNAIGFASQKAVLFAGDIKSNIEFGRDVSQEELQQAIEISQSQDIVSQKIEGVQASITQGGTNVSGGQKQRLSIARSLAKDKKIYIFDDSFSALDYQTDKKLRAALNELIKRNKASVIIVAQRISTIKNADKILVLNDGKLVGQGKHEELMNNCEVYREIAYSQLSKEELANATTC